MTQYEDKHNNRKGHIKKNNKKKKKKNNRKGHNAHKND